MTFHCMNTYTKYWLSEITHCTCNHTGFSKVLQAATASAPLLMSGHGLGCLWVHHQRDDLAGQGGGGGGGLKPMKSCTTRMNGQPSTALHPTTDTAPATNASSRSPSSNYGLAMAGRMPTCVALVCHTARSRLPISDRPHKAQSMFCSSDPYTRKHGHSTDPKEPRLQKSSEAPKSTGCI